MRSSINSSFASLAFIALAHCGSVATSPHDIAIADAAIDHSVPVNDCDESDPCPAGSTCFYPIGSCTTRGTCTVDGPPEFPCNGAVILCGCGGTVESGCNFPNGYASGPTTGQSNCERNPASDASAPPIEASTSPSPDGGTDLGPCSTGGQCPEDAQCYYPVGQCEGTPHCFTVPTGPTCGVIEQLCPCGSSQTSSVTGCGFPQGWASAPNSGFCDVTAVDAGPGSADSGL